MEFSKSDQIEFFEDKVIHQSAGGFVFYESEYGHILYIALLQKPDGKFYIPKGHILKNEKPEQAALREIKEELVLDKNPEVVAKIGIDSYSFTLPDDKRMHYKNVHLYVFNLSQKEDIKPLENEDFIKAEWLEFNEAKGKMAFDKENLLKARRCFYFHKPVKKFGTLKDIQSISIGIPTYNGEKTIYQTLVSVTTSLEYLPQYIEKEIIVCTDHCNDNTKQMIKKFIFHKKQNDIIFKLLNNDGTKGKSTVLNEIFKSSKSDLFCIVDDDVILENNCFLNLINSLIIRKDLICVFAKWKKRPLDSKNLWKKFWHWILGIKFDIQPYDKSSEMMRGPCLMFRRENFVYLPNNLLNEDQFLQYVYWPNTKEVENAIIYFNSVSSITDYYKRFIRIMAGSKQLKNEFPEERIKECNKDLYRKIDYKRISRLPLRQKLPFCFYRFIRFFINIVVKIRLGINENYEWFRIKQN